MRAREKTVLAPLVVVMLLLGFVPGLVLDAVTPVAETAATTIQVEGR